MVKKIIQVPMDEGLLNELNYMSRKCGLSRAEFIREACQQYLRQVEDGQMDEIYQEGYRRLPEEPSTGQTQVKLAEQILAEESW